MTVAEQLHAYVRDRAKEENVAFALDVAFFAGAVRMGMTPIFGVEYDATSLTRDYQEPSPGFLKQWKMAQARKN